MKYEDNNLMPYEGDNKQTPSHMEDYKEFGSQLRQNAESISDMADSIGRTLESAKNIANLYKECVLA